MALKVPEINHDTATSSVPWRTANRVMPRAVYLDDLPCYEEFFRKVFLNNQLCIIRSTATSSWASRNFWVLEDGSPNFSYLLKNFGDASGPVADYPDELCVGPKTDMKVKDYLAYWQNYRMQGHPQDGKCLYLKDWHFTRDFPSYCAYTVPAVLCSDWMNEFWDVREDEEKKDDYRFVYMGPKHSWTPFHADVLRSYSWSANICGQKKWIFYPPGEEEKLKDRYGRLVFDLQSLDLEDCGKYPDASAAANSAITIIQNPGEIIFVPSGWHHQVFNLEDTISINHNWMNGCSAHLSWEYIKERLVAVQKEIADCKEMDGWHTQCQIILKADSGMDYIDFYNFIATIATHRVKALEQYVIKLTSSDQHVSTNRSFEVKSNTQTLQGDQLKCENMGSCDGNLAGLGTDISYYSGHTYSTDTVGVSGSVNNSRVECLDEGKHYKSASEISTGHMEGRLLQKDQKNTRTLKASDHNFPVNKQLGNDSGTDNIEKSLVCPECGHCNQRFHFLCLLKGTVVSADRVAKNSSDTVEDITNTKDFTEVHLGEFDKEACSKLSPVVSTEDHTSCPHWAHCGPNLALFDLYRVLDIIEDMQGQEEFKAIMENDISCDRFLVCPTELIDKVQSIIKEFNEHPCFKVSE